MSLQKKGTFPNERYKFRLSETLHRYAEAGYIDFKVLQRTLKYVLLIRSAKSLIMYSFMISVVLILISFALRSLPKIVQGYIGVTGVISCFVCMISLGVLVFAYAMLDETRYPHACKIANGVADDIEEFCKHFESGMAILKHRSYSSVVEDIVTQLVPHAEKYIKLRANDSPECGPCLDHYREKMFYFANKFVEIPEHPVLDEVPSRHTVFR